MVATGAKKRFSQIKNHTSVLQLKNCKRFKPVANRMVGFLDLEAHLQP